MKKKLLLIILTIMLAVFGMALTACNDNTKPENETVSGTEIIAPDFEISNDTLYQKLPNSTTTYSFIDNITVADTSKFTVSTDINGINTIPTKTVSLNVGDNVFYILVTDANDALKLYTVTLRVKPIYNVSFNTLGGSEIASQSIEEDSFATIPTSEPTKDGYIFQGWNFDFTNTKITSDISISANEWQAIQYTIKFEGNNATSGEMHNQNFVYGQSQNLSENQFKKTGYSFVGWKLKDSETYFNDKQNISNYTTKNYTEITLIAQWQINRYNVTISKNIDNAGTITGGGQFNFDSQTTIDISTHIGYDFLGLYDGENLITTNTTYTFNLPSNDVVYTAKWKVKDEMSAFNFNSTRTTCSIIGIKDTTVTEIIVPDYITSIESGAFNGCSSLQNITLPFVGRSKTLTGSLSLSNGEGLFGYIFGTTKYVGGVATKQATLVNNYYRTYYIPETLKNVTITGGNIQYGAFFECGNLTSITIGDTVETIGEYAFYNCRKITNIVLGKNVKTIKYSAFQNCMGLTSITIPSNVKIIEDYAFSGCCKLVEITNKSTLNITKNGIDNGLVGYYAILVSKEKPTTNNFVVKGDYQYYFVNGIYHLMRYLGTETEIYLPNDINGNNYVIHKYFWSDNKNITKLNISNGVISIGDWAFYYCENLTDVTFSNSVTSIGEYAFCNCDNITDIVIPSSVTSIGNYAFSGCCKLSSIKVNSENTKYHSNDNCLIETATNKLLVGCKNSIIPNYVAIIGEEAFQDCIGLVSISIPESVTAIGDYAFSQCTNLSSINIPSSVKSIGRLAFCGCSTLTKITIGSGVNSIGDWAFVHCSNLTDIIFEDTTTWYRTDNESNWQNKTSGTQTNLNNSSSNATFFKSTYFDFYWYKK